MGVNFRESDEGAEPNSPSKSLGGLGEADPMVEEHSLCR